MPIKPKKKPGFPRPFAKIIKVLFDHEITPNRFDDEGAAKPKKETDPAHVLTTDVSGWRVADSLMRLLEQVDRMAPNRKKASDGTIGDTSHQKRDSDHNPWVIDGTKGVVTARDITDDPANGCSAQAIADALVAARDPRVKYIIWNRRIVSAVKNPWKWRAYTGPSPHTHHIHISVQSDKALYDDRSDWNLTGAQVEKVRENFGAASVDEMQLAWGKKVSLPFKRKVIAISARLGIDPNNLMAAMAFESARTFSADIVNKASGATGLIQFMPKTAESLGTTTAKLAAMTAVEQLDFVETYFLPHAGKLGDLNDLYMAILWPKAIGKPASFVLFAAPEKAYQLNRGLDANDDGAVTKAEAANRVQQHLIEGMRAELRG